jgi:DNA-binding MarR family transcriptional regulator
MSRANGSAIDAVRRFNRFYTRRIGVLDEGHLESEYSLTEVRVLYELAHRARATASELCRDLSLDPGYLSRMVRQFTRRGLVRKTPAVGDRRQAVLVLTAKGARAFAPLDTGARDQVQALLAPLSLAERKVLVAAMRRIEALLEKRGPSEKRGLPHS